MKKYIFAILSTAFIGFSACSEDTLDEINKDDHNPTPDVVPASLQLADAILSTGYSTSSGDYAFYLSSLNEQEMGVGNNQLSKAEERNSLEWASSSTFNNVWNSTYSNLKNIREIIRKIETEVPGNVGQYDLLGMAQVLEVLNWGMLTDMHGDIPYSESMQGKNNLQPKLDAQKDVYAGMMSTLEAGIANLEKGKDLKSVQKHDLVFGGDPKKWLATAYAVKARYLLHQLAVNPSLITDVKSAAQKAIELGFDGCNITLFDKDAQNPWYAFYQSRKYTASSNTVVKLMEANDDPRLDAYTNGKGFGSEPGDMEATKIQDGSLLAPAWLISGSNSVPLPTIHILSKSELYFILAEAQLRTNEDATEAYQIAVEASVKEILTWMSDDISMAATFAASLGTPTLKTLFEQKYLAQCVDEQVETYNDFRRLEAMGESYITLTNPHNKQSGINRYPYRLPYGNSSVTSNPNVADAYGDGFYIYEKKTWINGGN